MAVARAPAFYPWARLGMDAWWLGFESANVIALRMLRIASGGSAAAAETQRMVSEKMTAACLLQWRSWLGLLGHSAPDIADGDALAS